MNTENAEAVAIQALAWIAGEDELMMRFLALSGLTADTMRSAAADPGFLSGVLAFLMGHEPTLEQFCAATDTAPEMVVAAYKALGGAQNFESSI